MGNASTKDGARISWRGRSQWEARSSVPIGRGGGGGNLLKSLKLLVIDLLGTLQPDDEEQEDAPNHPDTGSDSQSTAAKVLFFDILLGQVRTRVPRNKHISVVT